MLNKKSQGTLDIKIIPLDLKYSKQKEMRQD